MNDYRLVEWTLDDISGELRRISLVSAPALEEDFMLFNSNIEMFKTVDAEKRVLTGVAMRPNIKIPRRDKDNNLYYGFFSEETVIKSAELFFKNNSNANKTNLEHQFEVEGIFVFESWIVIDAEKDKAVALGFTDVKKGDWFVSMKIENDTVWNDFLKTGFIKGFSVEIKAFENEANVDDTVSLEMLSKINEILENTSLTEDVMFERISDLLK